MAEATALPEAGAAAPQFTSTTETGEAITLGSLAGQWVVLYFYPKDDTPGCTVEAKEFRDLAERFEQAGARILGVSPDKAAKHCKFRDKFDLNFTLLCDTEHAVADLFHVWVEKSMYGKKYMGMQRATFLIDREGRIAYVWPKVKPEGHAREVLEKLTSLQQQ